MTTHHGSPADRAALDPLLAGADHVEWSEHDNFVLSAPDDCLLVDQGTVDLFAVDTEAGSPQGAWRALCRLGPGTILTGPMSGPRHRILIRRVDDAVVRVRSLMELRDIVMDAPPDQAPSLRRALADAIESTILTLARSMVAERPPREFSPLSTHSSHGGDNRVAELEDGEVARSVDDVLWVDIVKGELGVGGRDGSTQFSGDQLCLTRQDWISARRETELAVQSTEQVIAGDEIWRRMVVHWTRFLAWVDRAAQRGEREAWERIERSHERDQSVQLRVREANDRFINQDSGDSPQEWNDGDRHHLSAVRHVLGHLRADTEVPPSVRHTSGEEDYDTLGATGWVRTRPLRLEGLWWRHAMGPLVGYWAGRPVALIPSEGGYLVIDPTLRTPLRVTRDNSHEAGRTAWVVYPPLPGSVTSVSSLLRYGVSNLRAEWWLFGTMAALVGVLGLVTPVLNGRILGDFVASANRSMIIQGGLAVIFSALVAGAFSAVQNLVVLRVQGQITATTQTGVWARLLQLPVTFFQQYSTGRLGTIVLGVKAAQEMLSGVVVAASLGLVVASANLALLFVYSVTLGALGVALAGLAVGFTVWVGRRVVSIERQRYTHDQKLTAMTYETLSAITKIRATAAEERAFLRWTSQQRVVQSAAMNSRRLQDLVTTFNAVYPVMALATLFAVSTLLPNQPSLANLISFLTSFNLLLGALLQFTGCALTMAAMVPMIEALRPVLQAEPESGASKANPGDLSGRISLRQLSFRYGDDGPLVLDDVSLEIHPGEFVAFVGESGSGKSTVLRLILGFDRPTAGSILFDGQDAGGIDLAAVRRQCGVVLQTGALQAGDIRDNISGGRPFTEDEVWEAAEMAGLADVIKAMPMGLNTVINETTHTLSGGQVQRLMIARALVSRPRIVIFDEATSALDNPTQRVVAESTRQLNATRIVVAHRLSTVKDADRIVVMDQGRIVAVGPYAQLVADESGPLAQLAAGQR